MTNTQQGKESVKGNYRIELPDIVECIAEVEILEWPVAVGDMIKEDDVVCVVMTDKASVEIPAPVDGEVIAIGAPAGQMMAVGSELMRLHTDDAQANVSPDEPANATPVADSAPEPVIESPVVEKPVVAEPAKQVETKPASAPVSRPASAKAPLPRAEGEKPIAAPAVRQRARNAGIDLRQVHGTGPAGRITHDDLDAFIAGDSQPVASSGRAALTGMQEIPVIGLRRKIAQVMQDAKQRIPHFTYVEEIDVTELEALRQKLNAQRKEGQPKLTVLPFIMRAIVVAMREYPQMSSRYNDVDNIVEQYAAAHIGIATQTDKGLMVPVVRHSEALSLWESADEIKRLSSAAREGGIKAEELNGSTSTITSLG
ncbi:MAG: dihydrolipoamide acetyltransferase family protein, partial [Gammaproteobacteria bacterium]